MTKGRKPKPTELRLFEGNREHRSIPTTPKPQSKLQYAPRWLDPLAKKEWKRISKELYALGLLTTIDKVALEGYCQCYAKWHQGKTYTTSIYPTANEALDALQELIRQIKRNVTPNKGKITISQFVKLYLEKYIATRNIDNVTKYKLESSLRNQIISFIGHLQLKSLDGEIVQDYQNALLAKYKSSTARIAFFNFKRMIHRAIIWGYVLHDPTLGMYIIKYEIAKPEILTPEQIISVIYNEHIDLRDRCIIGILGFTGIRISECMALIKEKILFNEHIIRIDFRFYSGVVKPVRPSSKGKPRTVPILPDLEPILKEWYLKVGGNKWLFPGYTGKPLNQQSWAKKRFKSILRACGLPLINPHALRHGFDKMCSDNNVPPRELMQIMGHSTPEMTFGTYDRESVERLVQVTRQIKYKR